MSGRGQSVCVWLLLAIMQYPLVAEAFTSKGTEFFLSFLDAQYSQFGHTEVVISTTSYRAVSATVSAPLLSWTETVIVTAANSQTVRLPSEVQGHGVEVANRGVHVLANDSVTVMGVTKSYTMTDSFLVLPVPLLGREYFFVTYNIQPECLIVATADDTKVSLPLRYPITLGPHVLRSGIFVRITLNKFQTFHMHRNSLNADFTGLRITSNKPVAVICGNRFTFIGSSYWDHCVAMLFPADMYGTRYYATHTPNMAQGDVFKVVALQNDTTVFYGEESFTLRRSGNYWVIDVPKTIWRELTSDKPVMVAMFSKSYLASGHPAGDPSMMILPSEKLFAKTYSFGTPVDTYGTGHFNNSLSVVIDRTQVSGLKLDGNTNLIWNSHTDFEHSNKVNLEMHIGQTGTHTLSHGDPKVNFLAFMSGVTDTHISSYLSPAGIGTALHSCSISGDPHLSTNTGQSASLALPCAFMATIVRLTNVYSPQYPQPIIPEMKIEVVGGNSKELMNGRVYISDVCVKPTLGDHTNTFCIGENLIANGTFWTNETGDMLQDHFVVDYNADTKEAIFQTKDASFVLRFRAPNRQQSSFQRLKPGIFIEMDSRRLIYEPSVKFPVTLCSTTDDSDSIATEAAKEKIHPMFMGIYAMIKHMQSNIEAGSQDEQCPNFITALAACDMNQRIRAVNECFALIKFADYAKCFMKNGIKPSQAFLDCLDFICSSGATGCPAMTGYALRCPITKYVNLHDCPSGYR